MTNWLKIIKEHQLEDSLFEGRFGLERENIRVDKQGHMALTNHPNNFAEKSAHPYITTDFAESQIELITPICHSTLEAKQFIETLQDIVNQELKDEYLWPYSQPPILPDDDTLITVAQFKNESATDYRNYLADKYGKYFQMLSGVHFNFSFTPNFLEKLHEFSQSNQSYTDFYNGIYFKIARFFVKHSWLISYMFGYGEIVHQSFFKQRQLADFDLQCMDVAINPNGFCHRSGINGYQNLDDFIISFDNINQHLKDLNQAISKGYLRVAREFYGPLRVKGKDKKFTQDSLKQGIEYLEIRNIDLNPFEESGISLACLDFIHLFLIYGFLSDNTELTQIDYALAHQNNLICAKLGNLPQTILYKSENKPINIHDWAKEILDNMKQFFHKLNVKSEKLHALNQHPAPVKKLIEQVTNHGYIPYFLQKAKKNLEQSLTRAYQLRHYEDLELSTQALLREAIKQGIEFEFLDRKDNFLELRKGQITQQIKQATKTSLDHYISVLAMENKIVTKKLLAQKNLIVAQGKNYTEISTAIDDYHQFKHESIVIKPNSTNYGDGITILNQNFTFDVYQEALEFAFQFDEQILIEHFFPGKEYRFLVLGHETIAVLHRDAANVIGDGKSSIEQLVLEKNKNPLRGEGYKKPLEKIHLGAVEIQFLNQQRLNIDSIPAKDEKIYLRKNSNISTGGDSIDFTDDMLDIYKQIAVKASQSVDAFICGVDMIIKDLSQANPNGNYCIIELNFNPAIHMHIYPLKGKDRKITLKLLKALKLLESN